MQGPLAHRLGPVEQKIWRVAGLWEIPPLSCGQFLWGLAQFPWMNAEPFGAVPRFLSVYRGPPETLGDL